MSLDGVAEPRQMLLLAGLALLTLLAAPGEAGAQPCVQETFDGAGYDICTVDPAADLRLFWRPAEGGPYRTFANVARATSDEGRRLVLALNAGMYDREFSPLGLYVENGEQKRPLNSATVEGSPGQVPNFYKKPNGVFFLDEAGAHVVTAETYKATEPQPRFATQSGPMLVIDNQLHPALIAGSSDRTRRSGVGVCGNGEVRFAISQGSVNFYDFARLFRDRLDCRNALFLDGGRGVGLYQPELGRNDISWHGGYGPMFGLVE